MTVKSIAVLGSTGSVGRQALDVARFHGLRVTALAAGGSSPDIFAAQLREFRPALCAVSADAPPAEISAAAREVGASLLTGAAGVERLAAGTGAETVVNAISGIAGLRPTVAALKTGVRLALANKESLVCAGDYIMRLAAENGAVIMPVDSEHSAIRQCIEGGCPTKLYLTCSGGPFFGKDVDFLRRVTPREAISHPTWSMGEKISVDSATLLNKGLEVIEAAYLFGVGADDIEVLVHRESVVHSLVEFADGAVLAQLGLPDMRLCVQYALTGPERVPGMTPKLDLTKVGALTFVHPDTKTFRLLDAAYGALRAGGAAPAALNGANERAVRLFLDGRIGFYDITEGVCAVAERDWSVSGEVTPDCAEDADRRARAYLGEYFGIRD